MKRFVGLTAIVGGTLGILYSLTAGKGGFAAYAFMAALLLIGYLLVRSARKQEEQKPSGNMGEAYKEAGKALMRARRNSSF